MPPKKNKKITLLKDKATKDLNEFELDDLRVARDVKTRYMHEAHAYVKPPNITAQ
jgi:hypothetical protein